MRTKREIRRLGAAIITTMLWMMTSAAVADAEKYVSKAKSGATYRPQPAKSAPVDALTKRHAQQLENVRQLMLANDERIERAVMRQRSGKAMRAAIKKIAATKDPKTRQQLIAEYQKRYRTTYRRALAEAKVNPKDILAQARRVAPNLRLQMVNEFGLMATSTVSGFAAPDEPPPPTPLTVTTRIRDFQRSQSVTAHVGAGANVRFRTDEVEVFTLAVLAGGVRAEGQLSKQIPVPADAMDPRLKIRGTARGEGLAIGVAGAAMTSCFTLTSPGNPEPGVAFFQTDFTVFAPIFWVNSHRSEQDFEYTSTVTAGSSTRFRTKAYCLTAALLSPESHGKASTSNLRVELIYER